MTLTAPAEIEYQFDGSDLTIPLIVTGTNAAVWLVINTKGQADNIKQVRNGFLGWHYVNNVDKTTFCAFDSIHSIITSKPIAVEEEGQSAFSVDQNSPNPFNPATSISFSIAEAGNVTVDIFNVAGQKVDTLANDFMDAGKHSVVWDASGFSNGVYFYTVKSGDFSRTMKMTLLK